MLGHPTGEYSSLEARDRLNLLTKLVDKAMPDRQEAPMLPEDSGSSKTIDVRNLSDAELEILANAKPAQLITDNSDSSSPSATDSCDSSITEHPSAPNNG